MFGLVPMLLNIGLPILAHAVSGVAGDVVKNDAVSMIAKGLGVSGDNITDIIAKISTEGSDTIKAMLSAKEAEAQAKWPAIAQMAQANAEVAKQQIDAVKEEMTGELTQAGQLSPGLLRNITICMQTWWRPLYAFEGLAECGVFFFLIVIRVLYAGFFKNQYTGIEHLVDTLVKLTPVLSLYMGARFALLGYYMKRRTDEKVEATRSSMLQGFNIGDIVELVKNLRK